MNKSGHIRYRYVDYYKAVSIILVILAHATFANAGIVAWIHSFNMPAFFAASGLLLKSGSGYSLPEAGGTLWKRLQSIILPYFIWALVYASLTPQNVLRILYGSHVMLRSAGSLSSLWFLPTLFLALCYFEAAKLIFKSRLGTPVKLILMAASFAVAALLPRIKYQYPWNFNVSFYAFGFVLLGNLLFPCINAFRAKLLGMGKWKGSLLCAAVTLLSLAGTLLYHFNIPEKAKLVNTADAIYGNFPVFLVVAIFGTVFTAAVSVLLDLLLPAKPDPLSFIGQSTLCILVTHKPIVQTLFRNLFSIIPVPAPVALIVTCVGTLAISCLLTLFIDRYLPILAGKFPKKTTAG